MATPVVLHVTRPYASVEEYIAAEAWTVDARNMLLIDEGPQPVDTMITFAVTLRDGSRPIKAEARVLGSVEPADGRPGGLRVRFKRYGAPTKAFIDRAMTLVASGGGAGGNSAPATASNGAEPSSPEPSVAELSAPSAEEAPAEPPRYEAPPAPSAQASPAADRGSFHPVPVSPSNRPDTGAMLRTLRARTPQAPETPSNREYLLEKLRQRGITDDETSRYQRHENDDVTLFYRRP